MNIRCSISFWSNVVGCFCHEALPRALHRTFADCRLGERDLAWDKYKGAADADSRLERSAWFEFLRNGPSHEFALPSGVTGRFSRYAIEFHVPPQTSADEVEKIRTFVKNLHLGEVQLANT